MPVNLGNVVGIIRSVSAPSKKYVLWGKILNPSFPDIVDIHYWDSITAAWVPVTDPTTQYWLRPVLDNELTTPPSSPSEGDRYLIPTGATGSWASHVDQVTTWKNAAWVYQTPLDGFIVSVRTKENTLYDYRGVFGSGGEWVENDFQVPVAPDQYIPITYMGQASGVAPLGTNTKINPVYLDGNTLPYTPLTPGSWPGGTTTISGALDYLITQVGGGGGGGSGTVTEVSIGNLSPLFTTNVTDATTEPSIAFTLSNQSANQVFAGPTSGGSAAPAFRSLVANDIPSGIDASKITTGILDIARIPAAAIERVFIYTGGATLPENAGLNITQVQNGDIVKMNSTGIMYVIANDAALNNAASFVGFNAGVAASVPWAGITGKPTFYYQTIAAGASSLTQHAILSFGEGLTAYDDTTVTRVRFGGYFADSGNPFLAPTSDGEGLLNLGTDQSLSTTVASLNLQGYGIGIIGIDALDLGGTTITIAPGAGGLTLATGGNPLKINLGSDATGDTYYRNSSGNYTRRAIGSTGQVYKVVGGLPTWSANGFINLSDAPASYSGQAGNLIRVNAGATGLEFFTLGTAGSVTAVSVGNLSPLFNASVSTPSTTPLVTFAAISQTANKVYASPDLASGAPTFRALTLTDLPNIPTATLLGRNTASTGPIENITLGSGLTFNGSTLRAGGATTGDITWVASSTHSVGVSSVNSGKIFFTSSSSVPSTSDIPQSSAGHFAFSMRKDDTDSFSFTEIVNKGDSITSTNFSRIYSLSRATDAVATEFGSPSTILTEVRLEALGSNSLIYLKSGDKIKLDYATNATGDMYYRDASGWLVRLPIGTTDQVIKSNGTIPIWGAAPSGGHVIQTEAGTDLAQRPSLRLLNGLTAQDSGTYTAIGLGGNLTSNIVFTGTAFNLVFDVANGVIGGNTIQASSVLNLISTTKALLLPRISTEGGITTPADGMVYYNTASLDLKGRINGQWSNLTRPSTSDEPGAAYTLTEADRNKFIVFTNTNPITVTLPQSSLSTGFSCMLIRGTGAGQITIATAGTLQSAGTVLTATNGWISVYYKGSSTWLAAGAFGSAGGGGGGGGITNGATNNEIPKSDGTNIVTSGIFVTTAGSLTLGSDSTGVRSITAAGSLSDVALSYVSKGLGSHFIYGTTSANLSLFASPGVTNFNGGKNVTRINNATTAPATGVAEVDVFYFYGADTAAGNSAPHFRTELGQVIKLFRAGGSGWGTTGYTQTKTLDLDASTTRDVANYAMTIVEEILKPLGFCTT